MFLKIAQCCYKVNFSAKAILVYADDPGTESVLPVTKPTTTGSTLPTVVAPFVHLHCNCSYCEGWDGEGLLKAEMQLKVSNCVTKISDCVINATLFFRNSGQRGGKTDNNLFSEDSVFCLSSRKIKQN